jgi:atypical dual specificity phosphatase
MDAPIEQVRTDDASDSEENDSDEDKDEEDSEEDIDWLDLPEVSESATDSKLVYRWAGDIKPPDEFASIPPEIVSLERYSPRLYLGNVAAAVSEDVLSKYKITHVITILDEPPPIAPSLDQRIHLVLKKYDSMYESVLYDFIPICRWMESVLNESTSHRIFLHCFMGVSRSATFALAYWMFRARLLNRTQHSAATWLARLKTVRPCVRPNPNFMNQLCDLDFWMYCPPKVAECILDYAS